MSLYQRYLDYLNQAMPDISGIFRTTPAQAVEETTEETVAQPVGITPQLLQLTGGSGGDGFSVYNPDPTRTRTLKDYQFPFKFTGEDLPEAGDYISGPTGIKSLLSMLPGQGILKGIGEMIPPNRRAILENQALGAGIALDDIGRVVQGPGAYDTAKNVMAGYNLNMVTPETINKRREMIKETMNKEGYSGNLQERLDALNEFEKMMFGSKGINEIADIIYGSKMKKKDPTYQTLDEAIAAGLAEGDDDDDDFDIEDYLKSINTFGPVDPGFQNFLNFQNLTQPKTGIETIPDTIDGDARQKEFEEMSKSINQRKEINEMFDRGEGGSGQDFTGGRFDRAESRSQYDKDPTAYSGSF